LSGSGRPGGGGSGGEALRNGRRTSVSLAARAALRVSAPSAGQRRGLPDVQLVRCPPVENQRMYRTVGDPATTFCAVRSERCGAQAENESGVPNSRGYGRKHIGGISACQTRTYTGVVCQNSRTKNSGTFEALTVDISSSTPATHILVVSAFFHTRLNCPWTS
jgi:hypothetical protein